MRKKIKREILEKVNSLSTKMFDDIIDLIIDITIFKTTEWYTKELLKEMKKRHLKFRVLSKELIEINKIIKTSSNLIEKTKLLNCFSKLDGSMKEWEGYINLSSKVAKKIMED